MMDDSDLISKNSDSENIDSDDSDSENLDNKKIVKKNIILDKSDDDDDDEKSDDEKSDISINDNLDILSELNQTDSDVDLDDLDDETSSIIDTTQVSESEQLLNNLNDRLLEINKNKFANKHPLTLKESENKNELTGSNRITKPYFTKYEICRIISIRTNQLSQGMITPIDDTNLTINQIVKKEFLEKNSIIYKTRGWKFKL